MSAVLIDTGPIVALLDAADQWHARATQVLRELPMGMLTCEPVLAETAFLLRHHTKATEELGRWLSNGAIRLAFSLADHHREVLTIMNKYRDLPMSLADACLVRMAEIKPGSRIFTFDRHFSIYRMHRRRKVPLLAL